MYHLKDRSNDSLLDGAVAVLLIEQGEPKFCTCIKFNLDFIPYTLLVSHHKSYDSAVDHSM